MPMLALDGTTIPLVLEPIEAEVLQFGDEVEAFDGTTLTRIRAEKDVITLRTPFMPLADANTIEAVLDAAAPHAATGDLLGSVGVIVRKRRKLTTTVAIGRVRAFEFTVRVE